MAIKNLFSKKEKQLDFSDVESKIFYNIFSKLLEDEIISKILEVFKTKPNDSFSVYDIKTSKKINLSLKYLSQKLDLLASSGYIEKKYLKKKEDKRVKLYYSVLNNETLRSIEEIKKYKKSKEDKFSKKFYSKPSNWSNSSLMSNKINISHILDYFSKNSYFASDITSVEKILKSKNDLIVRKLELKNCLEILTLSEILDKEYLQKSGDKRPKLYFKLSKFGREYL